MKRFILTTVLFVSALFAAVAQGGAKAYTVETVPNVRLTDIRQYVSDPSGILTPPDATLSMPSAPAWNSGRAWRRR